MKIQTVVGVFAVVCSAAVGWMGGIQRAAALQEHEEGLRTVQVERFGVVIRVPQAWSLVGWGRGATAFDLKTPQEPGSPFGHFRCDLGLAPESLEELRKESLKADEASGLPAELWPRDPEKRRMVERLNVTRKLTSNRIEAFDPKQVGEDRAEAWKERWTTEWRLDGANGSTWFERRTTFVVHGCLYTFRLTSDEAHYDAYRLDFEDSLGRLDLTPPETGVQRLAGGYWMQRQYRFALWLPAGWSPAFAPHDKALFYAAGSSSQGDGLRMTVMASPAEPIDWKELRESLPKELVKLDPQIKVTSCDVVAFGDQTALETHFTTSVNDQPTKIVERRFTSELRTYHVRFMAPADAWAEGWESMRKCLDSFREVPAVKAPIL